MPEEGGGGTIFLALQSQIIDFLECSSYAWEKKQNNPKHKAAIAHSFKKGQIHMWQSYLKPKHCSLFF